MRRKGKFNTKTYYRKNNFSSTGMLFNVLSAAYFAFLSPLIVKASLESIHGKNSFIPWLGIALIIISVLEVYAFPKKMKYVQKSINVNKSESGINSMILWFLHMVVSIVIFFMTLSAFGYNIDELGDNTWFALVIFAIVIKELYLLISIMGLDDKNENLTKYKRPNKKEWILDLILLIYAWLAYTVTWGSISANGNMDKDNVPMYIVNLFAASMLFLIFYLPLRIPYLIEETAQFKSDGDWLKFTFSIVIVLAAAVFSL